MTENPALQGSRLPLAAFANFDGKGARRTGVGLAMLAIASAAQPEGLMAVPFDQPAGVRWGYADAEGHLRVRGDLTVAPEYVQAGGFVAVAHGYDSGVIDDQGRWLIPLRPGSAEPRLGCRDAVSFTSAAEEFTGTGPVRMRTSKDHIVDRTGRAIPWPLPKDRLLMSLTQGASDCWMLTYGSGPRGWSYVSTRGRRMLYGGFGSLGHFSCFGQPRRCLASASPKGQADGLHGLIDEEGRWVVTPRWPSIDVFGDNGLARAGSDERWSFIDEQGRTVLRPAPGQRFESQFTNGRALASVAGLFGFIDSTGHWTASPRFAYLGPLSANGLAAAREPGGTAEGYVDAEGRWRILPAERLAHSFSPLGLAAVQSADGCTTLINAKGDTVNAIDGQDQRWQPERCRASRLQAGLDRFELGQSAGATALLLGTSVLALWLSLWAAGPGVVRPLWRRALRAWAAALLPSACVALALGVYRFVESGKLSVWEGLTLPQRDLPTGVVLGTVAMTVAVGFGILSSACASLGACYRRPPSAG